MPDGRQNQLKMFMRGESKTILCILLSAIIAIIVYFNCGVYYNPVMVEKGDDLRVNRDVLEQLKFLKRRMHNGAARDMQKIYPEGYVFMQALYGLAWCDVADVSGRDTVLLREAQEEIDWAYWNVLSKEAKDPFDRGLKLPYGAFYSGWSNYLLGRKLQADGERMEHPDVENFRAGCVRIARFLSDSDTPYPESYHGAAWPADAVLCVASLALHDRLFTPLYGDVIQRWFGQVRSKVDSVGLIPHSVDADTGYPLENARGSSQCLMLNFLQDIDRDFAQQQFTIFKDNFLDTRFGLYGIREYPKGLEGAGDIDSGPVVFQMGAAASIVGTRTLYVYGEKGYAASLRNGIEAFGFPMRLSGAKMYLFGQLPMADVFITWAHADAVVFDENLKPSDFAFVKFHLYSTLVVSVCAIFLIILLKGKKRLKVPHELRVS